MKTFTIRPRKALLLMGSLLLLTAGGAEAATKTYQYYRFLPTKLRDAPNIANSCQMSEFQFIASGTPVPTTGLTVTNPDGDNPAAEQPANLKDGDLTTKWLDFNKLTALIFNFGTATAIDSYNIGTGGDAPERDPVDWVFSGSTDGINWVPLDIRKGFTADPGRSKYEAAAFAIPDSLDPVITTYNSDKAVIINGSSVTLNWQVDLADTVTISGLGSVASSGSQSVTPPNNALTTYTITGTNTTTHVSTTSTITVKTVAGGAVSYRYVKFIPLKVRDETATGTVQIAEFSFVQGGLRITSPVTATNPGGSNAPDAAEGALKAIDSNFATDKWLDDNKPPLIMDFGAATSFDAYYITTANDAIARDPVRWRLEGSLDGVAYTPIDDMSKFDFPQPLARNADSQDIPLPGASLSAPIVSFTADAPTLVAGQPAVLSWETEAASTISIDHGVGAVTGATGSVSVSPAVTTTYTLTTTKTGAPINTAQLTITVVNPAISTIAYSNFDNAGSELVLLRDASILNDFANRTLPGNFKRLRLTPDAGSKLGAAWFARRVDFSQGFDTTFNLSFITLTPGSSGADGIGFTIQNQGNSSMPPSEKGFTAKSFTVDFDSYINDDTEKSAATIQIVTNGNIEKIINLPTEFPTALGASVTDFTQSTGGAAPYPVRVTYGSGLLNIYVNSVQVLTNYPINLATVGAVDASGKGYAGFSARTGGIFEAHDVTAWSLTPGAPVSTGNPLAITASSINAATGALSLTWTSNAAKTYRITASTDLTTWTTVLKSGIASGGSTTTSATTFTPGAKGFFRVEEE